MYEQTLKLKDNEAAAIINKDTAEVREVKKKRNNIPDGYSKVDYEEFVIVNHKLYDALKLFNCSDTEIRVVHHMVGMSEFNTNSLAPLHDGLTVRLKGEILDLDKSTVNKITDKLFKLGIFLKIEKYTSEVLRYWVLNPYISWRGNIQSDALKVQFLKCPITKQLQ